MVAGGVLYVVGGWDMRGPGNDSAWADTVLALDLNGGAAWREIPAPFQRRALAAGTRDGRIYALGGLSRETGPVSTVDVLDPETGAWSKGPDLPRGSMLGFGAAAASDEDRIFVSQADGEVFRLATGGAAWEPVATLGQPRYMHRLIPLGTHLLAVGGAGREGHLASIEVVDIGGPDPEPAGRTGATRWAGFRGGRDTNVSRAARLPLAWSDDTVTWRTTTSGFGQSSPVIWDDTVFLTSLEGPVKETIYVTALDLEDGSERWRRRFEAAEAFEWNDYVSKGAPTPAVDGERLYAFFDSGDLMALTHDGDTVWHRDLSADYGTLGGNHGVGNSVLLTDDAVVILLTRRTYSYLLAVDPRTGETVWKADREPGVAWSTPVLAPGGDEIVVSASGRIEGFDAATGERRWSFAGFRGNHVPSPTVTGDLVIIGGMAVEANLALRRGGTAVLSRPHARRPRPRPPVVAGVRAVQRHRAGRRPGTDDVRLRTADPVDAPLGSIAPDEGVIGLRYVPRSGRWGTELSLKLVERYQQDSDDQFTPDAYRIVDLVSFVSLTEALRFRVGLLNLADAHYFEWWNVRGRPAGDPVIDRYSSPGRSVITSLAYDW